LSPEETVDVKIVLKHTIDTTKLYNHNSGGHKFGSKKNIENS